MSLALGGAEGDTTQWAWRDMQEKENEWERIGFIDERFCNLLFKKVGDFPKSRVRGFLFCSISCLFLKFSARSSINYMCYSNSNWIIHDSKKFTFRCRKGRVTHWSRTRLVLLMLCMRARGARWLFFVTVFFSFPRVEFSHFMMISDVSSLEKHLYMLTVM